VNKFGNIFKVQIFGESHGPAVGVIIDGCPSGIKISEADFLEDLERRKGGLQKGTTPRKEDDLPIFTSGIFNGYTTGAPLCIQFTNANTRSADYEKQRAVFRPGHADFTANKKFKGFEDFRGGGHFSGRLTVAVVAAGVVSKLILKQQDEAIQIDATIVEVGGEQDVELGIQKAIEQKDSVGGIIECVAKNIPVGWGEPFFDSVESVISHAVFSIPAIKGIEFGSGFSAAKMFGVDHNDAQVDEFGSTASNNAGGIVGGISNGNDIVFRIAVKPTSSTPKEQMTFNNETNTVDSFSVKGRHDLCIALRVPPVVEAVTAIALVDLMMSSKGIHQ
jgi:chorismate synthase